MKKPHWTDEEIDIIKTFYETKDKQELLNLLPKRSWLSIQHMAEKLRVPRSSIRAYLWPRRVPDLTYELRLYFAGLLDGDGSFLITVQLNKPEVGDYPSLRPIITIANSNRKLIDWASSKLNTYTLKTPYEKRPERKAAFTLQIARLLDVKAVCEQVGPYLVAKKRQAELLLEFCNIRLEDKWMDYNTRLFEIAKEVRILNKKGKKKGGVSE